MQKPHTTRTAPSLCPYCGHLLDAASTLEAVAVPTPGDLSICIQCTGTLVFTPDLTMRAAEPAELAAVAKENPELARELARHKSIFSRFQRGRPAPPGHKH